MRKAYFKSLARLTHIRFVRFLHDEMHEHTAFEIFTSANETECCSTINNKWENITNLDFCCTFFEHLLLEELTCTVIMTAVTMTSTYQRNKSIPAG